MRLAELHVLASMTGEDQNKDRRFDANMGLAMMPGPQTAERTGTRGEEKEGYQMRIEEPIEGQGIERKTAANLSATTTHEGIESAAPLLKPAPDKGERNLLLTHWNENGIAIFLPVLPGTGWRRNKIVGGGGCFRRRRRHDNCGRNGTRKEGPGIRKEAEMARIGSIITPEGQNKPERESYPGPEQIGNMQQASGCNTAKREKRLERLTFRGSAARTITRFSFYPPALPLGIWVPVLGF